MSTKEIFNFAHSLQKTATLLLLGGGCTNSYEPWKFDGLATGHPQYDSSRLIYSSPFSQLSLEFLKIGQETTAYLFLRQFTFLPIAADPQRTEVSFKIGEFNVVESIPLREGRMRLKLSIETTQKMILSLQEGKQIIIEASGIKETISPDMFKMAFAKFLKGDQPLHFIKGPFE